MFGAQTMKPDCRHFVAVAAAAEAVQRCVLHMLLVFEWKRVSSTQQKTAAVLLLSDAVAAGCK
jgi:hypothetical protein